MQILERLNSVLGDRYEVERELGAGGMATVYLARDVKHHRKVALKVLRPELGAVLGPDRFLTEINVSANLQHPHLLPLFDSGEVEGLLFYVMPFVEGESLRDRLDRERQLPVDESVRIAVAVASALDYAHRHGVIHRDLKPENILLNEGEPLVADFGIALAISNAGGARVTQTGLSLGTPQYMSPEQATGDRVIDARSDIYSLAAVLYEMLTGEPPHTGTTVQAIIARVLTDRPRHPRVSRETVPEHVDAAIMCALSKLPADRFATAGEFAEALKGARGITARSASSPLATQGIEPALARGFPRRAMRQLVNWAPLVVGVIMIGSVVLFPERRLSTGTTSRFEIVLDSIELSNPGGPSVAVSADGAQLAFVGTRGGTTGIFVRRIDQLAPQFVRGTESGSTPAFSPNGSWILFWVDGVLKKVPAGGGAAITVSDSAGSSGHWGPGNNILFSRFPGIIWRVSAEGGPRSMVARPDSSRGHTRYSWPHVLPDGKSALITIWKDNPDVAAGELAVLDLKSGEVTELRIPGVNPRYLRTRHILFARADGTVFAAPFSLRRGRLTGAPLPVVEGVSVRGIGAMDLGVSDNGTLAYRSGAGAGSRVVKVTRTGSSATLVEELNAYALPRVSPDGRRLAVSITQPRRDIWTYDMRSRTLTRLTTSGFAWDPKWSLDGQRIANTNTEATKARIMWQPWDGSGAPEVLVEHDVSVWEISFGPPHMHMAIREDRPGGVRDILIAPADSPRALRPFLVSPADERMPRVSPDGRLLAYISNESGRTEVYVRPLPGPGGRVQISTSGGLEPAWSPNGRELFYRTTSHFMSAAIAREPELAVARRDTLFVDRYTRDPNHVQYDVFPNGNEFVFVDPLSGGAKLFAVVNWAAELRRRMKGSESRN